MFVAMSDQMAHTFSHITDQTPIAAVSTITQARETAIHIPESAETNETSSAIHQRTTMEDRGRAYNGMDTRGR